MVSPSLLLWLRIQEFKYFTNLNTQVDGLVDGICRDLRQLHLPAAEEEKDVVSQIESRVRILTRDGNWDRLSELFEGAEQRLWHQLSQRQPSPTSPDAWLDAL